MGMEDAPMMTPFLVGIDFAIFPLHRCLFEDINDSEMESLVDQAWQCIKGSSNTVGGYKSWHLDYDMLQIFNEDGSVLIDFPCAGAVALYFHREDSTVERIESSEDGLQ